MRVAGFGKKQITKVVCFFSTAEAVRSKRDSEERFGKRQTVRTFFSVAIYTTMNPIRFQR